MNDLKASVIIPAYNGAEHLGQAIQSVLDQTYENFEVIIVNDASPQSLDKVISNFSDSRIKYIRHERNRGAVAARKTGAHAATGDLIAFLDQDDLFHREKLECHAAYIVKHPQVGMTYNARLEMQGSLEQISNIWQPPQTLTLADLVMGFPISPSDTVLRRDWALRDEIWDDSFAGQAEHVIFNGQEIVFGGRLALSGCIFGNVGRALNYRRFYSRRTLTHLAERCKSELACQALIFDDPRCTQELKSLRNLAASSIFMMWAHTAYLQGEFDLGREYLAAAVKLEPSMALGLPWQVIKIWVAWIAISPQDEDCQEIIHSIFNNLPVEFESQKVYLNWALARCCLLRGLNQLIWSHPAEARRYLLRARELGAVIDRETVDILVGTLLNYEMEFGSAAVKKIISEMEHFLKDLDIKGNARHLRGNYQAGNAFKEFYSGNISRVPAHVVDAVRNNPEYLLNRGTMKIFLQSLLWQIGLYRSV